jgi:hypothetical protein
MEISELEKLLQGSTPGSKMELWAWVALRDAAPSLAAELLELKQRERWIPTSERKPDESKTLHPYKADILFRCGEVVKSGTFQQGNFVGADGWVMLNATHWMPMSALPSPPIAKQVAGGKGEIA